jgi:hypothetical protein
VKGNVREGLLIINPVTAKVANKRLLGRPPKSLFGTKSVAQKRTHINIALLTWGVYNCQQTHSAFIALEKENKTKNTHCK